MRRSGSVRLMLILGAAVPAALAQRIGRGVQVCGESVRIRRGREACFKMLQLQGEAHFNSRGTVKVSVSGGAVADLPPGTVFEIRDAHDHLIARSPHFCPHCFMFTVRRKGRDENTGKGVYGCTNCKREWVW